MINIQPMPHKGRVSRCLPNQSDAEAIQSDWEQVGKDLQKVMDDCKLKK